VQGVTEEPSSVGAFELPMVHSGPAPEKPATPARWIPLEGVAALAPGSLTAVAADGESVLLARVNGSLLAYRDACAACGEPLHGGELDGAMLRCRSCGVEFDLPRAGRAAGGEPLQLTPVPLLEAGGVRVAV